MRTDIAQPVRLSDYRAPDFLIDKVHLDVSLSGAQTRVEARRLRCVVIQMAARMRRWCWMATS